MEKTAESERVNRLGVQTRTERGFPEVEFEDSYGTKCSLQASSLAKYETPGTSAIWLGIAEVKASVLRPGVGWVAYPIPLEVFVTTRMHLEREKVQALVNHLQAWLDSDTGEFEDRKSVV